MKILVNATTQVKGGGIQNAASFLTEALLDDSDHCWEIVVSQAVADQLETRFPGITQRANVFECSPAQHRPSRRRLKKLEKQLSPDCVFTFNGPAYVRFQVPHLLGFATPWVTHASPLAYRALSSSLERIKMIAMTSYQAYWFRFANTWVTETNVSKAGLAKRLKIDANKVGVVSNSCNQGYLERIGKRPFPRPDQTVRLLTFAAAYPQKRLEMIPYVADELRRLNPHLKFEFVITLPEKHMTCRRVFTIAKNLEVSQFIRNQGPVPIAEGPGLYEQCHVTFLPTLLETFSATYPESMAMGLPIVTSDLDFTRDVCRDAAVYFQADHAMAAAREINRLLRDETLWNDLIKNGHRRLQDFPTPQEKYKQYISLMDNLLQSQPVGGRS